MKKSMMITQTRVDGTELANALKQVPEGQVKIKATDEVVRFSWYVDGEIYPRIVEIGNLDGYNNTGAYCKIEATQLKSIASCFAGTEQILTFYNTHLKFGEDYGTYHGTFSNIDDKIKGLSFKNKY